MFIRILTWNVCGWRSILRKGFVRQMLGFSPDIICLQEIRTHRIEMPLRFVLLGYDVFANYSARRGFHGTAVITRLKPLSVVRSLGHERFDSEGRFLRLDFRQFTLINVYMPYGGRDKRDLGYKLEAYNALLGYLRNIDRDIILVGDFNIAHKPIDLARPKANENSIMFTLAERRMLDRLVMMGFVDAFRIFNKRAGNYTWWPRTHNARERNIGWRIDYIFASKNLRKNVKEALILSEVTGSDHCPVLIEIEI